MIKLSKKDWKKITEVKLVKNHEYFKCDAYTCEKITKFSLHIRKKFLWFSFLWLVVDFDSEDETRDALVSMLKQYRHFDKKNVRFLISMPMPEKGQKDENE